jgi:hypothetical protein
MLKVLTLLITLSSAAAAQGLDRDTLLTDAPAVPAKGTVRVTGGVTGTSDSAGVDNVQGQAVGTAAIQWTIFDRFAADVSAYFQVGQQGPAARVRYQILKQADYGLDLSAGVRFKTVGFHPDQGEVELLVAAGRTFGRIELVLNAVIGFETAEGGGKDGEIKAFAGYRLGESVRVGIDERLQAELADDDENENTVVGAQAPTGRDYDLTVGPALSWMITRELQLQALAGVAQPKKTNITAPVAVVQLSFDF